MGKKYIAVLIAIVIFCTVIFTSCNKAKYTNPVTGEEYILVTDENGNKVLSEDGELLVYATDEKGKKIKDDDGNYVTEVHGFIGQIESNGVIEDYAYYLTLPDGWKTVDDKGNLENKRKGYVLSIDILEETFNDYYAKVQKVVEGVNEAIENGEKAKIHFDEYEYDNVDSKVCLGYFQYNGYSGATMFFSSNDNLYILSIEQEGEFDFEDVKAEMLKIFDGFEFKPYAYYEGLTDAFVEETE